MMNTLWMIMAEFESGQIPLEHVAEKYLNLSSATAARRASTQELPFPAFRAGTQMSPWMVRAQDLAEFIDREAEKARTTWKKMNDVA